MSYRPGWLFPFFFAVIESNAKISDVGLRNANPHSFYIHSFSHTTRSTFGISSIKFSALTTNTSSNSLSSLYFSPSLSCLYNPVPVFSYKTAMKNKRSVGNTDSQPEVDNTCFPLYLQRWWWLMYETMATARGSKLTQTRNRCTIMELVPCLSYISEISWLFALICDKYKIQNRKSHRPNYCCTLIPLLFFSHNYS